MRSDNCEPFPGANCRRNDFGFCGEEHDGAGRRRKDVCECRDQCDGCLRECGGWNTHAQGAGAEQQGTELFPGTQHHGERHGFIELCEPWYWPVVSICTPLGGSVTGTSIHVV